ncbi:type II secretion system F family protein [Streptomyces sp. NPDC088785]|uniref:type II secretion system F family protein n=1 Tax=Streptomyces sp. NPDC088785 TaxID=3365897 RepID=UPI003827CF7F
MEVVHRLGAVLCAALAVVWLARAVEARWRERELRRRVRLVLDVVALDARRRGFAVPGAVRRWAPVAGAVSAGYVVVGGVAGLLVGAVAGGAVWRWRQRRAATTEGDDSAEARRQLPLAADLLAACIAAGAVPVEAARVVGEPLGGPVGRGLARGAAQVRLGGEPGMAWRELARLPGAAVLVRLLERSGESGAPAAGPVARIAAECRAERGRGATAVARRAAVAVTAPVGLCFLPAFLVIGVLPVVIGLGDGMLGGR